MEQPVTAPPSSYPWFYSREGLHVEMYDSAAGLDADQADVSFVIEQARDTGGPVLELASGTGRALWPIAEAGFDIVGLDINEPMLRRAEAKRQHHDAAVGERARLVQGDMRDFDLGQRFKLIFITFRSFQAMLTPEDQRACLTHIHRHLHPGGRVMIDIFDPRLDMLLPEVTNDAERWKRPHPVTGHEIALEPISRTNDPLRQVFDLVWEFTERDASGDVVRQERERLTLRWTYRYEMRYLLELSGFDVLAEYSDFKRSPPAYGREQVWVAQRA